MAMFRFTRSGDGTYCVVDPHAPGALLGEVARRRHDYDANKYKGTPRARTVRHACWQITGDHGRCFDTRQQAAVVLYRKKYRAA